MSNTNNLDLERESILDFMGRFLFIMIGLLLIGLTIYIILNFLYTGEYIS